MKLYTEEQVKRIAKLYRYELYLLEATINTEKPIELPSDEEIDEYVKSTGYYGHCTHEYHEGIQEGAKWMREQIKGGNK